MCESIHSKYLNFSDRDFYFAVTALFVLSLKQTKYLAVDPQFKIHL